LAYIILIKLRKTEFLGKQRIIKIVNQDGKYKGKVGSGSFTGVILEIKKRNMKKGGGDKAKGKVGKVAQGKKIDKIKYCFGQRKGNS